MVHMGGCACLALHGATSAAAAGGGGGYGALTLIVFIPTAHMLAAQRVDTEGAAAGGQEEAGCLFPRLLLGSQQGCALQKVVLLSENKRPMVSIW